MNGEYGLLQIIIIIKKLYCLYISYFSIKMLITLWKSGITHASQAQLSTYYFLISVVFAVFHNFFNRIILSSFCEKSKYYYTNCNFTLVNY